MSLHEYLNEVIQLSLMGFWVTIFVASMAAVGQAVTDHLKGVQ